MSDPPNWRASATPASYGVAGSCVVEMTTTGARPGVDGVCGVDVGGTGQKAHISRGA
ncbi:Uncharacterised protein [Mycobacteroides abscessus subsp. abscessus]|nr:Uncharacterised protein [Mycobacteroides abscessus subsp. abscessus]